MTIKESVSFYYNSIYSVDKNISNVTVTPGMQSEPFVASRRILEQKIKSNSTPYYMGVEEDPLIFNVAFAFNDDDGDAFTATSIREVARWLVTDTYEELYFTDDTTRRYFAMVVEDSTLVHNMMKQGYINLTFRCDSPYTYSAQYLSDVIKTSTQDICATGTTDTNITATGHSIATGQYIVNVTRNDAIREVLTVPDANNFTVDTVTGMTVNDIIDKYTSTSVSTTFTNSGDLTIMPEMEIVNIGTGTDVVITNTTNASQAISFSDLDSGETVYINNETNQILTSATGVYRYSAMSGDFLEMLYGVNNLTLSGNFTLQFRSRYTRLS